MNTTSQYKELKDMIDNKLILLDDKLKNHQNNFNQNPTEWGFVGDLQNISTTLDEVLETFK